MSISVEVNEAAVAFGAIPRAPPARSRWAARRLLPGPARTDQPPAAAQPFRAALARSPALPESWVARRLLPSPPFPDPNGEVSGSAWAGPDLPGTRGGERGGDDSIAQVFGVSELRSFRPLAALAPRGAAALARGLGGGKAGSSSPEGHPSLPGTMRRPRPARRAGSRGTRPARRRLLRPRKRALEQFADAASSRSSFPVINVGAASQLPLEMLHPQPEARSRLRGDPDPGPGGSLYLRKTPRLSAGPREAGPPAGSGVPGFLPPRSSALHRAGEELGVRQNRTFPDASPGTPG